MKFNSFNLIEVQQQIYELKNRLRKGMEITILNKIYQRMKNNRFFKSEVIGYENHELVDSIIEKTLYKLGEIKKGNITHDDLKVMLAISLLRKRKISVIDLGGGAGFQGLIAAELLRGLKEIRWNVVDTKTMVKKATSQVNYHGLNFYSEMKLLKQNQLTCDLLYCDSALQYLDDPKIDIERILKLKPEIVYFTRIPLSQGEKHFSYLQKSRLSDNGPSTSLLTKKTKKVFYKCNIYTIKYFLSLFNNEYDLILKVSEGYWEPQKFGNNIEKYTIAFKRKLPRR